MNKQGIYDNKFNTNLKEKQNFLLDLSFEEIRALCVLCFIAAQFNNNGQKNIPLPNVSMNEINILFTERLFFSRSTVNNNQKFRELKNLMRDMATDKSSGSLLNFNDMRTNYKIIGIDLS